MREAKLRAAQAAIEAYAECYRRRKQELNPVEIALYEAAMKLTLKALAPREAKAAIVKFEELLAEQRARAEAARQARLEKSKQSAPTISAN